MHADVQVAAAAAQQAVLDDWLAHHPEGRRAVVAENALVPLQVPDDVPMARLAAGCVCCTGQLPLRVALVRLVRAHRPERLLLLVASADHLPRVRALLADGSLGVRFELE